MIVYISIGNSDDKLTQAEWAGFLVRVHELADSLVDDRTATVHGRWLSSSDSPWQNACWCVEFVDDPHLGSRAGWMRKALADLVAEYRQDSIAWAEVPHTEFIGPSS